MTFHEHEGAHHAKPPRSRAWLRALVLLLALLVPGTHAEVRATSVASSAGTTVEYDVLDPAAALRPVSLTVRFYHRASAARAHPGVPGAPGALLPRAALVAVHPARSAHRGPALLTDRPSPEVNPSPRR